MIGFPSNILVVADYPNQHFLEAFKVNVDFVLSCGGCAFQILEEVYERFGKPIFAVKGKEDSKNPFPKFVQDVHFKVVQHRNWLIGGWQGMPSAYTTSPYEWDDVQAAGQLSKFPYVDIFICQAPLYKTTDKQDDGSQAILQYVKEKQPKCVYHGRIRSKMGAMVGKTAAVSVFGAEVFYLT